MTDFPSFKDDEGGNRIVYVRSVKTAELPKAVQARAPGVDHLYAILSSEGEVLALVPDRRQAFIVARQNEFSPVSVH
jgi:hypothetical protein